jgi:hypothetical protein
MRMSQPLWHTNAGQGPFGECSMSKRAAIFKNIMRYIDEDDYDEYEGFWVFGKEAFEAVGSGPTSEELSGITRVFQELKAHRGHTLASERTSLEGPSEIDMTALLGTLSPKEVHVLRNALWLHQQDPEYGKLGVRPADSDDLDRHYAIEMIERLNRAASLVLQLEPVDASVQSNEETTEYFREVHKCLIYGLRIATAVMCRALLEAALEETVGDSESEHPSRGEDYEQTWVRSNALSPKKRRGSPILRMLDSARQLNRLSEDLVRKGEEAKDAGDCAVHRLSYFREHFEKDNVMLEVVRGARQVIEALYRD